MNNTLELLTNRIDLLLAQKEQVIVAIDGSCAAGKTTLAGILSQRYDCNVFHMDNFFLRPEQRTPERYAEAGGNVDYERFLKEVLIPLKAREPFFYRPFDCGTLQLTEPVGVAPKKLNIIEGTYSLHPYFGNPYDLKIFLTVTPECQRKRILERPAFLHKRFFEQWIPMEQQYFDGLAVASAADIEINGFLFQA